MFKFHEGESTIPIDIRLFEELFHGELLSMFPLSESTLSTMTEISFSPIPLDPTMISTVLAASSLPMYPSSSWSRGYISIFVCLCGNHNGYRKS